jgi:hypothetical protein
MVFKYDIIVSWGRNFDEYQRQIEEACKDVLSQTANNREKFAWNTIPSFEANPQTQN